jgi:diguanylate cyclase (GGDEF)-like protein
MASINLFVGVFYLFFYLKKPSIREHLPFALLCLGVGIYDVFCAGLYNSRSLYEGIFWQKVQIDAGMMVAIFLMWFTSVFTEQKRNKVVRFFIIWFAFIFLVLLIVSPMFSLTPANPDIKNVSLFNWIKITYYEGELGLIYQIIMFSCLAGYGFLFYLFIRYYLKTKNKILLLIISAQVVYFLGLMNDALIAWHVYSSIYLSEYTYLFIVASMTYVLLDKFMNTQTAFEELSVQLEKKVNERTREIEKLNNDLKHLAECDGLTGIYNRRFFNEYFEIEVKRAKSFLEHKAKLDPKQGNDMNFGLAIIDIDQFKPINDTYGHQAGDSVLRQITRIMKENMFTRDVLCRYGGDEFVMLLTKTSNDGILQAAEKIRKEIEEHAFDFGENRKNQHVTISVGLVNFNEVPDKNSEDILKVADDRLLLAKSRGKNRVVYGDGA